ncbi:unnamed protein product [Mycena citricolor]|uniref:Uncharacterized protein n=1 Tax=Mycena citricolor TaxID=2018698 RepID=A0AAD2HNX5_9AGAR|nr:unnamed protein product [Mycena citricolor]
MQQDRNDTHRVDRSSLERHTVLGSTVASSHDLTSSSRRRSTIDRGNRPSRVLSPMVRDIQTNHGCPATGRSALREQNLRDLAVLPKVLVGSQRGDELDERKGSYRSAVRGYCHASTHFFLGKAGSDAYDVDHVTLHYAYVGQMASAEGIEFLALPLALFLLLRETLVAVRRDESL